MTILVIGGSRGTGLLAARIMRPTQAPATTEGGAAVIIADAGKAQVPKFDLMSLIASFAAGLALGGAFQILRSLDAMALPVVFTFGAGVLLGILLILASRKPAAGGGRGPNGPDLRALLLALGIAVLYGSAAFLVVETIQNPPVRFWPRIVVGFGASIYWWLHVFPTLDPAASFETRMTSWFATVIGALGAGDLAGWL